MIFIGCLIGIVIALAPRLVLILGWIFSPRWDLVWQGNWLFPVGGDYLCTLHDGHVLAGLYAVSRHYWLGMAVDCHGCTA